MNARIWTRLVVLVGLFAPLATGQPQEAQMGAEEPTISLQFPGGSLEDYVNALKSAAPQINIALLVREAREIQLPAMKLDAVGLHPAVQLLQGEFDQSDGKSIRLSVTNLGGRRNENPVFSIRGEWREARRAPVQVRVWNISGLIGGERKAEDVLTAVETALGLLEGYDKAKIRYHKETSLIVASGEEEQLRAIDRVIIGIRQADRPPGDERTEASRQQLQDWIESHKLSSTSPETISHLEILQRDLDHKDKLIAQLRMQLGEKKKE